MRIAQRYQQFIADNIAKQFLEMCADPDVSKVVGVERAGRYAMVLMTAGLVLGNKFKQLQKGRKQ